MDMNRTITLDLPGEEIYTLGKQHWSPGETISFDVPEEECISFVELLEFLSVVNHQIEEKQDQITLIEKEADKEMTPEDINFIYDLLVQWSVRDYMKRNQEISGYFGK